jgi:hypothetical protein
VLVKAPSAAAGPTEAESVTSLKMETPFSRRSMDPGTRFLETDIQFERTTVTLTFASSTFVYSTRSSSCVSEFMK